MTRRPRIEILRLIVNEIPRLIVRRKVEPASPTATIAVLCLALVLVMGSMTSLTDGARSSAGARALVHGA